MTSVSPNVVDGSVFAAVDDHRDAVETLADRRTDDLGAAARVLLALDDGEIPRNSDLAAAGLPTHEDLGVEGER